ncbi:hypothetical protein K437DRAFT_276154 [Tilletiaria anomala UBC 951]|uniref:ditrans,polycis-polyprenyl diphosphate synthase [(2E,6E)-farnesyldiphosphate specific] n=1 Tax=Tilletiaria anomala (strain ATCC 24038 / CBS 436.72 / UBC 951) TaxID=1037660 RepID=A0A066VB32_TILAU|nr:uncharacterized protein K437DRAFT_276154 [Tilletiaria anomala UBC 951]KDN38942.1 hypothetical protein K437DRAFT_276154 [Tilletiaria anomala UBC 951]
MSSQPVHPSGSREPWQARQPRRRKAQPSSSSASKVQGTLHRNRPFRVLFLPIVVLAFGLLHCLFHLLVSIGRTTRRIRRGLTRRNRMSIEAVFEHIGHRMRAQLDSFNAGEGEDWPVELQVVHDVEVGSGQRVASIKVARHLAIVFADRSDTLAGTLWKALKARAAPQTHAWEQQESARLLERQAFLVQEARKAVRWAALLGVDQISIYDDRGLLKDHFSRSAEAGRPHRWTQTAEACMPLSERIGEGEQMASGASSDASSSIASLDFDQSSGTGGLASSASSLPSTEPIDAIKAYAPARPVTVPFTRQGPGADTEAVRASEKIEHCWPRFSSYHIEVELCISGQHDVSLEFLQARRKAAIWRRQSLGFQDRASPPPASSPPPLALPLHVTLNVLSREDGKHELVGIANELRERVQEQTEEEIEVYGSSCSQGGVNQSSSAAERKERREIRSLLLDRIDARKVDAALEERGCMGEPELLIVKGGSRRVIALHGFPPWPVRLTEIYHCGAVNAHEGLKEEDVLNALLQYSGSTQRYGR